MEIQAYDPEKHGAIVSGWWEWHLSRPFQPALLPPVGVVGHDEQGPCCACWLHLSAGVGVCFVENPVSRPGMLLSSAKTAFRLILGALEEIALIHDYGAMVCHTPPAIARFLSDEGFSFAEGTFMTGTKLLR